MDEATQAEKLAATILAMALTPLPFILACFGASITYHKTPELSILLIIIGFYVSVSTWLDSRKFARMVESHVVKDPVREAESAKELGEAFLKHIEKHRWWNPVARHIDNVIKGKNL